MDRKNMIRTVVCLIVLAVAVLGFWKWESKRNAGSTETSGITSDNESLVTYQGKKYKYNTDLKTFLFLGVDKEEDAEQSLAGGKNGQADTIILYVMDRRTKTSRIFQIPRDTMAQVSLYDTSGTHLSSETMQIALQYAYGDSAQRSSFLMKEAVSELFYGVKVDGCITLHVDGIKEIVDALGGVAITIPEDYTMIDPSFKKGQKITLDGEKAERYVRYRDVSQPGSNLNRMKRQSQFVHALFEKAGTEGAKGTGIGDLLETYGEYLYTDLYAEDLKQALTYELVEEYQVPGKMHMGEEYEEYHVDEEALYDRMMSVFYVEA